MADSTAYTSVRTTRLGLTTIGGNKSKMMMLTTMQTSNLDECFDDLTNVNWNVYSVSRLFNFDSTPISLKNLRKKLCEYVSELTFDENFEHEITSTIKLEQGFVLEEYDAPALHIQICLIRIDIKNKENVKKNIVYEGYFLCRGVTETEGFEPQYPVLFSRNNAYTSVEKNVNAFIEQQYDCIIRKYPLDQSDLKWLFAAILDVDGTLQDDEPVKITYTCPQLDHKNEMEITTNGEPLKRGWKYFRGASFEERPSFSKENVENLFACYIYKHVQKCFKIHPENFVITDIHFPNASFFTAGKLKVQTAATAEICVKFLTLSILHQTKFEMKACSRDGKLV